MFNVLFQEPPNGRKPMLENWKKIYKRNFKISVNTMILVMNSRDYDLYLLEKLNLNSICL